MMVFRPGDKVAVRAGPRARGCCCSAARRWAARATSGGTSSPRPRSASRPPRTPGAPATSRTAASACRRATRPSSSRCPPALTPPGLPSGGGLGIAGHGERRRDAKEVPPRRQACRRRCATVEITALGRAGGAAPRHPAGAAAGGGRDPDRGARRRRQPARRRAAGGRLAPPPGASDLPGLEAAGEVAAVGPGGLDLAARGPGDGAAAGRRLRRIRADPPGPRAAAAGGHGPGAGGRALRDLLHRLEQRLRPRPATGRREPLGARRVLRHRHHRHPAGGGARAPASSPPPASEANARPAARSGRSWRSTTARPTSWRRCARRRAGAASTWCSTWSGATTCRGTSGRWRRRAGW